MKDFRIDGKIIRIEMEDGRKYNVATDYIEKSMTNLDIDMEEAVMTWLEDEGYLINEDQEELCVAAKENKITIADKKNVTKEKKRTIKEKPTKERIIAEIAKCINAIDGAEDIVIENKGKIITFRISAEEFKIDLVQKRKKKGE